MFPTLEATLIIWIKQVCCQERCVQYDEPNNFNSWILANNGRLTDGVVTAKAQILRDSAGITADELKLSKGWLQNFKDRFHLSCFELHGEAAEADMDAVGFALRVLPVILKVYAQQVTKQLIA